MRIFLCFEAVSKVYHNLFDSHTHSDNSLDAQHSVMYMAEHAEHRGLMGLAVTDHAECIDWMRGRGEQTRIVQSIVDAAKTGEAFRNRMSITNGVEVGLTRNLEVADRIVDLYPFDFVIGSIHHTRAGEELYALDYAAMGPDDLRRLMDEYFEDMLLFVEWGRFSALGHMNFPSRCAKKNSSLDIDLNRWSEAIDEVLRALVQKNIALELNASGLRAALDETMPPEWVLRRYRELGGELVTIGSDAHRVDQLGQGVDRCMAMLESLGYGYFSFYRKRMPIMLRIV